MSLTVSQPTALEMKMFGIKVFFCVVDYGQKEAGLFWARQGLCWPLLYWF